MNLRRRPARRWIWLGLLPAVLGCSAPEPTAEVVGAAQSRPIPEPDLTGADPSVRVQIEGQRRQLRELEAGAPRPAELAEAYGELGLVYVTYSFLEAAEACFANAEALRPSDYRWPYLLGYLYQLQGLPPAAETLRRALELDPEHPPTRIRLGRVELELGNHDPARVQFEVVLSRDPESAAAVDGLAQIAAAEGQVAEAIPLFERALALQPSASSLHHRLGLAYRRSGDLGRAQEHLEQGGDGPVLFADPLLQPVSELGRSAEIYLVRAAQAFSEQRYELAATNYREALEIDPKDFTSYKALGFCLEKLGDIPGAMGQLETALRLATTGEAERDDLERAEVYRILGGLAVLHQDDAEGIRHFRSSLELNPSQLDARFKLANALARHGRLAEAVEHYDTILRDQPDHTGTLVNRATALVNLGRSEEALADFERAIESSPDDPQLQQRYAEALEFLGQTEAAREQRARLERLDPGDRERADLAAEKARQAQRRGDFESAVEHLRAALDLVPDDADLRFQLARILGHLESYDEAIAELERVLAVAPRHGPARRAEVTALLLTDRYPEARRRLQQGLEVMPRDRSLAHTLARLLAIAPDARARDGALAVELALRVQAVAPGPEVSETLAMAYAEVGRLGEAVEIQTQVLAAAERAGEVAGSHPIRRRLAAYQSHRPWRALDPDEIIRLALASAPTR